MPRSILHQYDFNKIELLNVRVQNLAAAPGSPAVGQIYFDTVLDAFRIRNAANSGWIDLSVEAFQDLVGAMLSGNTETGITVTYQDSDGTIDFVVTDSPLLEGSTKQQVIDAAVAAVVNAAPTTLDTLDELAAALGDDANFAATVTTALGLRTKKFAANVGDAAATSFNVDHNLNSLDVVVNVFKNSTGAQVEPDITRTTVNRTVIAFAFAPAVDEYRVVVVG